MDTATEEPAEYDRINRESCLLGLEALRGGLQVAGHPITDPSDVCH